MKLKERLNLSDISFKKVAILAVVIVVILIIIIKTVTVGSKNPNGDISEGKSTALTEVTVTKVTDGDTIWVKYEGYNKKIRLIGINCPESVSYNTSENTEAGQRSSDYVNTLIKKGDTVYIQMDTSDKDKYSRYLRYVWLEKPNDVNNEDEIRSKMLNAIILLNGYADAVAYEPDVAYSDLFTKFMEEAKSNKVGLWAE